MKETYIYIMEANDTFKVGIGKCPSKRLKQLQTGNPYRLKLLKSFEIDTLRRARLIEKLIHRKLELKLKGEWFQMEKQSLIIRTEQIINSCLDYNERLLKMYIDNNMIY